MPPLFQITAEGQFTPLFEVHQHQWFADMLLSWTEYDEFVRLMRKDLKKKRNYK